MPCPLLLLACWPYTHQLKEKASDLYVEDGAVKGGSNFNIRVITDSASYALAAKALLDQSKVSGWPFEKAVNVYAAGGAKPFVGVMFAGGKEGNVTGMEKGWGGRKVLVWMRCQRVGHPRDREGPESCALPSLFFLDVPSGKLRSYIIGV